MMILPQQWTVHVRGAIQNPLIAYTDRLSFSNEYIV
jgi:hypothetical protein